MLISFISFINNIQSLLLERNYSPLQKAFFLISAHRHYRLSIKLASQWTRSIWFKSRPMQAIQRFIINLPSVCRETSKQCVNTKRVIIHSQPFLYPSVSLHHPSIFTLVATGADHPSTRPNNPHIKCSYPASVNG
jgi:hypothetical protein